MGGLLLTCSLRLKSPSSPVFPNMRPAGGYSATDRIRSAGGKGSVRLPSSFISFRASLSALLAVAAGLAFYFGEWEEGSAIVGVLVLNTLIGFVTEIKAVRSIEALRVLGTRSARVCRDGRTRLIPAERLVPGDIVLLDAGDVITADLRLVEASNLEVDESTLTGESMGVGKTIAPVDVNARVSDRSSMLFKGTSITRGSGIGVVVATGMDTELGHISRLVEEAESERPRRLRRSWRGFRASLCG